MQDLSQNPIEQKKADLNDFKQQKDQLKRTLPVEDSKEWWEWCLVACGCIPLCD